MKASEVSCIAVSVLWVCLAACVTRSPTFTPSALEGRYSALKGGNEIVLFRQDGQNYVTEEVRGELVLELLAGKWHCEGEQLVIETYKEHLRYRILRAGTRIRLQLVKREVWSDSPAPGLGEEYIKAEHSKARSGGG